MPADKIKEVKVEEKRLSRLVARCRDQISDAEKPLTAVEARRFAELVLDGKSEEEALRMVRPSYQVPLA